MFPRISAKPGALIGEGWFNLVTAYGDHAVTYARSGKDGLDQEDLAKAVMLVAFRENPANPHLPAMFQLPDGTIGAAKYEHHFMGMPELRYLAATRKSLEKASGWIGHMRLKEREVEALNAIVDVLETMPQYAQERAYWDICGDNVMQNSEGELVFVDPLAFSKEPVSYYGW